MPIILKTESAAEIEGRVLGAIERDEWVCYKDLHAALESVHPEVRAYILEANEQHMIPERYPDRGPGKPPTDLLQVKFDKLTAIYLVQSEVDRERRLSGRPLSIDMAIKRAATKRQGFGVTRLRNLLR